MRQLRREQRTEQRLQAVRGGGPVILQIPHDMHEWDDETRRQWLALVATHPDVTPRMLRLARAAVAAAESGQPPTGK